MFKFLVSMSLILMSTANADTRNIFVIQPTAVKDVYGYTLASKFIDNVKVRVLTTDLLDGNWNSEAQQYLTRYLTTTYDDRTFISLSKPLRQSNGESVDVLESFDLSFTTLPVYVVSDTSSVSRSRLLYISSQVAVESFTVFTASELRNTISTLQSYSEGVIVINTFRITDEWNAQLTYYDIEHIVVTSNNKHIDIGVCGPRFQTSFAVGFDADYFDPNAIETPMLCSSIRGVRRWPEFLTVPHRIHR
jgi:hypothetical protein